MQIAATGMCQLSSIHFIAPLQLNLDCKAPRIGRYCNGLTKSSIILEKSAEIVRVALQLSNVAN